jgi:hypothetical protein
MEKLEVKNKLRKYYGPIKGAFKHSLPTGATEFDKFCERILGYYNLPNVRSYKEAIAHMIQHLDPLTTKAPLTYFAKSIKKAQANQAAFHALQKFKEESKAEEAKIIEEEKAKETAPN